MSFSVCEAVTIRASATLIFRQVPRFLQAMTTGQEARPIALWMAHRLEFVKRRGCAGANV